MNSGVALGIFQRLPYGLEVPIKKKLISNAWLSKEGKSVVQSLFNLKTWKLHDVFSLLHTYDSIMKTEFFLVCVSRMLKWKDIFCVSPPPPPWGADGNAKIWHWERIPVWILYIFSMF